MENDLLPDPNVMFPVPNIKTVTYIKPTIKNKNIIVGDFTYFRDVDFESHVSVCENTKVFTTTPNKIVMNTFFISFLQLL